MTNDRKLSMALAMAGIIVTAWGAYELHLNHKTGDRFVDTFKEVATIAGEVATIAGMESQFNE